jgi:thioredoxin 2
MAEAARLVVCPHCESVNRVPADKPAREAKCGRCHKALFTGAPVAVSGRNFDRWIEKNSIPVVVDFWADWCGPCKMMAPVFARVAGELEPDIRFLKLDTEAAPEIAARYGVRSIPMLILFRNGAILGQRTGAIDAGTLRAWLRQQMSAAA